MKYQNDVRKLYINNYNISFLVKKNLKQEQKDLLDSVVAVSEIYTDDNRIVFDKFVDLQKTAYINRIKLFTNDNPNIVSDILFTDKVEDVIDKQINKPEYSLYYSEVSKEQIESFIPERFKNLGVKLEFIHTLYDIDFKNESCEEFNKINNYAGLYYFLYKKISIKWPVIIFNKNLSKRDENIMCGYYNFLKNKVVMSLVHEFKHALNYEKFLNVVNKQNLSIYDFLKIKKYEEYSAEMEAVFYVINKIKEGNKLFNLLKNNYKNISNYILNHYNYYDNFSEFINVVKKDVEEKFLIPSQTYNNDYYLNNALFRIRLLPNRFSKKSDEGVYEKLKKEYLSFEIFNPNTNKKEIVDLSSFFEDEEITPKERYLLDKAFKKGKNYNKFLKKETQVSNKTLAIINNVIDKDRE